jgi:hypothetical protein
VAVKAWLLLAERVAATPAAPARALLPVLLRLADVLAAHDLLRRQAQALGLVRVLSRWTPASLDGTDGYAQRQALQHKLQVLHRAGVS